MSDDARRETLTGRPPLRLAPTAAQLPPVQPAAAQPAAAAVAESPGQPIADWLVETDEALGELLGAMLPAAVSLPGGEGLEAEVKPLLEPVRGVEVRRLYPAFGAFRSRIDAKIAAARKMADLLDWAL